MSHPRHSYWFFIYLFIILCVVAEPFNKKQKTKKKKNKKRKKRKEKKISE